MNNMLSDELRAEIEARQVRNKSWRGRFGEKSPIVLNEITPIIELFDKILAEERRKNEQYSS